MTLLVLMTLVTFVGPMAVWMVVQGGPRQDFPPDRPIEWIVLGGAAAAAAILMIACLACGLVNYRALGRAKAKSSTTRVEP